MQARWTINSIQHWTHHSWNKHQDELQHFLQKCFSVYTFTLTRSNLILQDGFFDWAICLPRSKWDHIYVWWSRNYTKREIQYNLNYLQRSKLKNIHKSIGNDIPGEATKWLITGTSNEAKTGEWSLVTMSSVQPIENWCHLCKHWTGEWLRKHKENLNMRTTWE